MKKLLALLLCLAMVATVFAACGDGEESSSSAPESSKAERYHEPSGGP